MQRKEYQLAACQISRKRRGHASLPAVENGSTVVGFLLLCSQTFDSCFYFQDVIDYIGVFWLFFLFMVEDMSAHNFIGQFFLF